MRKSGDVSPCLLSAGRRTNAYVSFTGTYPFDDRWLDPDRWSGRSVSDVTVGIDSRTPGASPLTVRATAGGGVATGSTLFGSSEGFRAFGRATVELSKLRRDDAWRHVTFARLFLGFAHDAPRER